MIYSTSPSCSSFSLASTSGRNTPDGHPAPNTQTHETSPHAGLHNCNTGPLSSNLPPFLVSTHPLMQQQQQQQQQQKQVAINMPPQPRRTSFGAALGAGGKLSALSAFGFLPSATSSPSPYLGGTSSLSTSPVASSSTSHSPTSHYNELPAQAQQASKPAPKRHMCFPDGMGGTMCVEVRDRDRRGSS